MMLSLHENKTYLNTKYTKRTTPRNKVESPVTTTKERFHICLCDATHLSLYENNTPVVGAMSSSSANSGHGDMSPTNVYFHSWWWQKVMFRLRGRKQPKIVVAISSSPANSGHVDMSPTNVYFHSWCWQKVMLRL